MGDMLCSFDENGDPVGPYFVVTVYEGEEAEEMRAIEEEVKRQADASPGFNRQYEIKNDKLHVCTGTAVAVLRPWPVMLAHKKHYFRRKRGWFYFRPELNLGNGYVEIEHVRRRKVVRYDDHQETDWSFGEDETDQAAATRTYLASIPAPVTQSVSRFRERQWHLLAMTARCPGALDLTWSNPALAFALASNWAFHRPAVGQPMRAARTLVRRKQREIAAWLGFPGTEAGVRVLSKVAPGACRMQTLLYLREAMSDPDKLKRLSHLPAINVTVIRVLSDPMIARLAAPNLLNELSQVPPERIASCVRRLKDIPRMLGYLVRPFGIGPLQSVDQLERRHNELRDLLNRDGFVWDDEEVEFPEPPVQGTGDILPVTGQRQLLAEAMMQKNCVAAYRDLIVAGQCYVYRVLAPERATLSLVHSPLGWKLGELSGVDNAKVGTGTWRQVWSWLQARGRM